MRCPHWETFRDVDGIVCDECGELVAVIYDDQESDPTPPFGIERIADPDLLDRAIGDPLPPLT